MDLISPNHNDTIEAEAVSNVQGCEKCVWTLGEVAVRSSLTWGRDRETGVLLPRCLCPQLHV